MTRIPCATVLVLTVLLSPSPPVSAQDLEPLGDQLQVNVFTVGDQSSPAVGVGPDGRFLIGWVSEGQIGLEGGIVVRRFTAAGDPDGAELPLDDEVDFDQDSPSVSVQSDGTYVVGWTGRADVEPVPINRVEITRVGADGTLLGTTQVQEVQAVVVTFPALATAVAADDSFFAAWEVLVSDLNGGKWIVGRRFAADLDPVSDEVTVTSAEDEEPFPDLGGAATGAGGGFFAVWGQHPVFIPGPDEVRGRQITAAGAPIGGEELLASPALEPALTALADGSFVVAWEVEAAGAGIDLVGRVIAADGSPLGPTFEINGHTQGEQREVVLAAASGGGGGFVAAWESTSSPGDDASGNSVQARYFAADGSPSGFDQQVNTVTAGDQGSPAVAFAPDGTVVVAWESATSDGDDASGTSVQMRRLETPAIPSLVSWWPAEGDAGDLTGLNPGQLEGGTGFVPALCGQAFALDGVDDSVEVADDPSLDPGAGDLSWSLWVRTSAASGLFSLLDKRTLAPEVGYHLFLLDGRPGIRLADGAGAGNRIAPAGVADGRWHQLAFTVDRGSTDGGRIWVDGELGLVFDPTSWPASLGTASPLSLGRRSDEPGGDAYYPGALDEVIFVRRALLPAEVYERWATCALVFADGFEAGDLGSWSQTGP